MVLFNYSTKELTSKIVYYGPGLCGKTTNLQFVYDSLPGTINKGKMLSLATKTDRTLFFDFLPIDLGMIRGMRTRLQLYTVPGQVFYNTTRKLVLKGADGVVFVADSQERLLEQNLESLRNLEENLLEHGMNLSEMPMVIQFNKRDLPEAMSLEDLNAKINRFNAPIYEAVATTGIGVHETLKAITRLVLNSLKTKYADKRDSRPEPAIEAAARAVVSARAVAVASIAGSSPSSNNPLPVMAPAPEQPPAPQAAAPPPEPEPDRNQRVIQAAASSSSPVALSQGFEEPTELLLPDTAMELEDVELASRPAESDLAANLAEDDFLLEVTTEEDQLLCATSSADELLELAETIDEVTLDSDDGDPLLSDLNIEMANEEPLDLSDLKQDDPLELECDPSNLLDPLSDAGGVPSLGNDLEPTWRSEIAVASTPSQFLDASFDATLDSGGNDRVEPDEPLALSAAVAEEGSSGWPEPAWSSDVAVGSTQSQFLDASFDAPLQSGIDERYEPDEPPSLSAPVAENRFSRFEEDRSALVLDDFDPTPLPLSHENEDDQPGSSDPVGGPFIAAEPQECQAAAKVPAPAQPDARRSGEINVPVCLSIGDQKIQFELKITLDMVSGFPKLTGVEATEERA